MCSFAARSGSSISARSCANPSSPFTRSATASGKWLTPASTGSRSAMPQPRARLRLNVAPTHSLHSPTVFTAVSRVTDRHSAVSGLVTLTNQASGATASTSRAMSSSTGNAPQRAQHAAGADAVADRLADAVATRDLDVVLHAVEAADREARDHEVGARERPLAVELGGRREADAAAARDLAAELLHQLQALGVEVVQHDARRSRATACWRSRRGGGAPSGSCRRRRCTIRRAHARSACAIAGPLAGCLRSRAAAVRRSATSTSISTAPPRGNAATPIAERECRPAAPNTSASSRLAPSTTAGCCANPARTRRTRAR